MYNVIIATNQSAVTTVISFTLTGPSGTVGFSNMTIPKSEVPYGKIPMIYIDDQLAENQGYKQDNDNYYVWYSTHFSTHQILIEFASAAGIGPTQSSSQTNVIDLLYGAGAGIAVTIMIVVILTLFIRTRKPRED